MTMVTLVHRAGNTYTRLEHPESTAGELPSEVRCNLLLPGVPHVCLPGLDPTSYSLPSKKKKKKKISKGSDKHLTLYRKMALLGCAVLVLDKILVRTDIFQNFHEVC